PAPGGADDRAVPRRGKEEAARLGRCGHSDAEAGRAAVTHRPPGQAREARTRRPGRQGTAGQALTADYSRTRKASGLLRNVAVKYASSSVIAIVKEVASSCRSAGSGFFAFFAFSAHYSPPASSGSATTSTRLSKKVAPPPRSVSRLLVVTLP